MDSYAQHGALSLAGSLNFKVQPAGSYTLSYMFHKVAINAPHMVVEQFRLLSVAMLA